jgi:uncharacterized protein YciI
VAYHLIRLGQGPAWDSSRRRREQAGWSEHAAYMDTLAAHGVVVLGGPIGDDDTDAVLVVEAFDASAALAMLAADPWFGTVLTLKSIEPWTIWLRARDREAALAG